ncbi:MULTISPECIES: methionine ABC transporter ATP-binding protein [unclassified Bosea (in: a-proteobacteria)]|uniref:methionine ABC transporter ATP-binding protein n=1 Tax=unclassified Bosea (in: a-proteobacteria) TaxID=2653178 RepID=UPI000954DD90|nr:MULTISPECIES: methionine ABC transporter ATP-binding protein [unclassified Bosea (in: a-proteobacteria)]TAJ33569.1 MAG: methionine ABC transporter ATP-binding protein [Bosea sp. (in: a-proteobacteria)]SIR54743.1 D-methionine transport system ATP-binding protein [Bosea sp. TND4EK4]
MNAPVKPGALGIGARPLAAPDPIIRFERIGKAYPGRRGQQAVTALSGIDLSVPAGAIVGVIGRSGAGKSTLIRLVNGLEKVTAGRLLIEGEDVTGLNEAGWRRRRREIGMIFQHFNLLSSRTVFDNVALPLEIAGTPRAAIAAKVETLLALVGLADKRERYPAELSGGQKQRVGIARALATDPKVLLCDEATSALDPETTRSILALLKQVNRELGLTILLITHEIPVIKEICDRVAVIEGGRIVEEGDTFSVFTDPQHPTTARFVEAVTGVELPAHLEGRIRRDGRPGDDLVLRITFTGENATAPVISRLGSVVGVDVNILAGRIDAIAGRPFGSLLVSVPSRLPESEAVLAALKTLDLKAEVIGHVS